MLKQQQTTLERWGSGRDLLLLAACVHPRFKLDRLESCQATTHTNKYTMEALLKAEIKMGVLNEDSDQSSDKDQEGDDLEDDFFNFLPQGKKSPVDTAEEELVRYLRSPSREVSSLHGFPRVLRCFLQHNTGMPSIAGKDILFPVREMRTPHAAIVRVFLGRKRWDSSEDVIDGCHVDLLGETAPATLLDECDPRCTYNGDGGQDAEAGEWVDVDLDVDDVDDVVGQAGGHDRS
ncbi:uncharacterized protein LOC133386062 [Rhineura floridana]|uniref:uncharacterized protein LOC133386062 n=1 Tax=Rhineura floridana TaxID=261503 RepID=UPI002AC7FAE4|nr:uncharacterized protein LOC133386062 [Rhineura floridana]